MIDEDKHHALSWIRTHGLSVKAIKAYASDSAANRTGLVALMVEAVRTLMMAMNHYRGDESSSS
jgi:hypothetical protein